MLRRFGSQFVDPEETKGQYIQMIHSKDERISMTRKFLVEYVHEDDECYLRPTLPKSGSKGDALNAKGIHPEIVVKISFGKEVGKERFWNEVRVTQLDVARLRELRSAKESQMNFEIVASFQERHK